MPNQDDPKFELVADKSLLIHWRDEQGRSWASVAKEVGLGSPGAARRLYSMLVRPHTESVLPTRNSAAKVEPVQLDGADLDTIRETIAGRTIIVQRQDGTEPIKVAKVSSLKDGTINFNDGNKSRSVKASAIIAIK